MLRRDDHPLSVWTRQSRQRYNHLRGNPSRYKRKRSIRIALPATRTFEKLKLCLQSVYPVSNPLIDFVLDSKTPSDYPFYSSKYLVETSTSFLTENGIRLVKTMKVNINNRILEILEGDITEMKTDAIVNAANAQLVLGGGVAGAIRKKGGPTIQKECNKIGGTYVGGAVITSAGNLKAEFVIHAVGPKMGEGNEDRKLRNATLNSLRVADENHLKSIAFPAVSAGIFGFPIDRCAEIMLRTTADYLKGETGLEKVVFCLFGADSFKVFEKQLKEVSENEGSTPE